VERDVAQQRADRRALRGPRRGVGNDPVLQYPEPQPRPEQLQHPPVTDPPGHLAHERVVIELPETVADVGIKHPLGAPVGLDPDGLKGLVGRASGPKPIACRQEVGLEDRLQDQLRRGHDHPVAHARDPKRPGTTSLPRLGDVDPPQRRRPIGPSLERCGKIVEEGRHPERLDVGDGDPIGAGRPSVCSHLVPGPAQDVAAGDLVEQGMEPAMRLLLGAAVQHALQRTGCVQAIGLRGGPSPHRALTDPLPATPASMKQGPFPGAGLCCPAPSSGTTTPSDCLSATRHFPALAGYRRELLPGPRRFGAEEALSSSHDTPLTIPRPLRRRVPWHPLQALWCRPWPSPAEWRLGSLLAAVAVFLTTPQASLDAADWSVAPRPASTPGSRPTPGAALPGTLASPRTGLPPAGCRELVARLHRRFLLSVTSAPELLDAHSAGIRQGPRIALGADTRRVACGQ